MRFKPFVSLAAIGFAFLAGCSKPAAPPVSQETPMLPPMMQPMPPGHPPMSMKGMPMMKEDPMSIKSVEGEIQQVNDNELIVFTKKNVTLKFSRDKGTEVMPKGKILLPGMQVRVTIDHIPQGMRAKTVEIIS